MKTKIFTFVCFLWASTALAQNPYTLSADGTTLEKWTGSDAVADMTKYPGLAGVTKIAPTAFSSNATVESIVLSKNVSTVDQYTFAWMDKIKSVRVEAGNGYYSDVDGVLFDWGKTILFFYPRAKEGETYVVPATVKSFGGLAFFRCLHLKKLQLPSELNTIGLGESFFGSTVLETVNLPDGLKNLPASTFSDCYKLKEVAVSKQLETIASKAFNQCQSLPSIELPKTLKSIGDMAFYNTVLLESITIHAVEPPTLGTNVFGLAADVQNHPKRVLYVPKGRKSAYQNAWGEKFTGEIKELETSDQALLSYDDVYTYVQAKKLYVKGLDDLESMQYFLYASDGSLSLSGYLNEEIGVDELSGLYFLRLTRNGKAVKTIKCVF